MNLEIRHHGLDLSESMTTQLRRRLEFALGRVRSHIVRVWVYLSDLNGPRGGVDKSCRIVVRLPGRPEVVVRERSADLPTAVDRAADRAGLAVRRDMDRRHASRRDG